VLPLGQRELAPGRRGTAVGRDSSFQKSDLLPERFLLRFGLRLSGREVVVVFPPVEADLLRLVDRADDQPDADGEELYFGERNLDVARDDEPLVEDAIEDVDEPARLVSAELKVAGHEHTVLARCA